MAEIAVGEKTPKLSPNQTDRLSSLDHRSFVSLSCSQNFSFLGSVEVGYLWLETTKQQQQFGFWGYLSPQLKLS